MQEAHRPGIRARLFFAFGALSVFTLMASVVGWVSQDRLGNELNTVVGENIRALSLMAALKEQGATITNVAPTLMVAKDEPTRQHIWQELDSSMSAMVKLLPDLSEVSQAGHPEAVFLEQIAVLKKTLRQLDANVLAGLAIEKEKLSENQQLRWVASGFLSDISALIRNIQLNLNSRFNQDLPDSAIVSNNFGESAITTINTDLQVLYRMKADVNLLVNLVDRVQHLPDLNSLIATEIHSEEVIGRINNDIKRMGRLYGMKDLTQTIVNIISLAQGENNMFSIRRDERALVETGLSLLQQVQSDLQRLNQLIGEQASETELAAQRIASNAKLNIRDSQRWMLLMVGASLLLSIVMVWFYVGRNVVTRITRLDASMRRIADGHLDERVPVTGSDEIGAMAESLRSFRDQLHDMQDELVQAGKLAALGQLSAGIAHEINQPLAAISHYAHNGLRFIRSDRVVETERNLQQIGDLTRRATSIITRLKSLARKREENLVVVELKTVVKNVLTMFEGHELLRMVTVELNFPQEQNEVLADPIQLEQVILNLFSNALDALADSAEKCIWINCNHRDSYIEISILDSGPGIDPALREKIFEPFFTTKRIGKGLGLGLCISYNIIKDFGGKLIVETGQEKGAAICIRLPGYKGNNK